MPEHVTLDERKSHIWYLIFRLSEVTRDDKIEPVRDDDTKIITLLGRTEI